MSSEDGQINSSKINKMALRHEQQQKEYFKEQESILKQLQNNLQQDEKRLLIKQPLQEEEEESESSYYYDEEDESEKQSAKNKKKEEAKQIQKKSIETQQIKIQNPITQQAVQNPVQKIQTTQKKQNEESEEESYYDEEEESEESQTEIKNPILLMADELDIAGISTSDKHHEVVPKPSFVPSFQQQIDNWESMEKKKILGEQNEAYGLNIKTNPFFDIRESEPESGELSPQFKKKSNLNSKFQVSNEINQLTHSFGVKQQDLQDNVIVNFNISKNLNSSKSSNQDTPFKSHSNENIQEKQIEFLNLSQNSVKNVLQKLDDNEQAEELNITITKIDKGAQKTVVKDEESAEEDQLNQEVYNKASGLVNNALITFQSAFPYDKDNRVKALKKILKAKTKKSQLDEQINDSKPEENSQELLKAINLKQTTFRESLQSKSSKNSSKLAQFSKYIKEQNQKEVKIQEEFERFKLRITQEKAELLIDRPMVDARFQINEILKIRSSSASEQNEAENKNKLNSSKVINHFLQLEETPRNLKEKLIMSLTGSKLSLNGSKSSLKQELNPEKNRTIVEKQLKERYFDDHDNTKLNDAFNSMSISENNDQHKVYKQFNTDLSQNNSNGSISKKQNNSQASEKFEQFRKQIETDLLRISKSSKKTPSRTEGRDKVNIGQDKKSSHSLSVKSCRVSNKSNQSEIIQSNKSDKKIIQNDSFDTVEKIVSIQKLKGETLLQKEIMDLNQKINNNGEEDRLEYQEQKDKISEEDFLFGQLGYDDIVLNEQQTNHMPNDLQEQTQETIQNQSGQQFSFIQQQQDEQQLITQPSFCEQNQTNQEETNQEEEEENEYESEEDNLEQSNCQLQREQFSFQNEEIYKDNFTEDNQNQFHMMEETQKTQENKTNLSQDNQQEISFQPEQQFDNFQNLGLQDTDYNDVEYRNQQNFDQLEAEQNQIFDNQISNDELNQDSEQDQEIQEEIETQENQLINNNIEQFTENYQHYDEKDDYQEDAQNEEYENLIQQQDQESLIQVNQKESETIMTQKYQIENQFTGIGNYQQDNQQSMYAQDLNQLSELVEQQEELEQVEIVNDCDLYQSQKSQQEQQNQELNPEIVDSPKRQSNTYTEVPSSRSSQGQRVNFHLQLENGEEDDNNGLIFIDQPYREMVSKQIRTQKNFIQKTPIVLQRPQTSQASRSKLKGQQLLSRNASAGSYNSLKRKTITQQPMNKEFSNNQNIYQMIRTNQTISIPLRRTTISSSIEKQEEIFYDKIARLSIPVRQQNRANSSSIESRNKKLRSLERLKSGLKPLKRNLNKQTDEQELNRQVQEGLKVHRTMSGLKIIKGRNKKIQTEEIKAFKIKITRPQTSMNRIHPHKILATSESQPQLRVSSPSRIHNYFDYKTMSETITNEERAKRIMNDIETLYQIQNAGATFKVQRNNKRDLLALKSGYHQIHVQKQGQQISFSNNQTMNIAQGKAEYLPEESLNNYIEVTWRDVQNPKSSNQKASKDQSPQGMQGLQQTQQVYGIMNKSSLARIKPHIFESERNPNSILAHQSSEQFLKRYQGGLIKQFKLEVNSKSQVSLPKYVIKGSTPNKKEVIQPEEGDKEPSFCNLVLSRTKLYSKLDPRIIQSPFLNKLR